MSIVGESFLSSEQLSEKDIEKIFARASLFKREFQRIKRIDHLIVSKDDLSRKVVAMIFSEPSTRTRLSFHVAAIRLGLRTISLDNPMASSLSKGETLDDTFRNVAAMQPDLMVVRYDTDVDADAAIRDLACPVINGGIGTAEHPTQALLDAFTINEFRGGIKGEKVLIVGDVLHSRVANSNLTLLKRLGAEIAVCVPKEFSPDRDQWTDIRQFEHLNEAVEWSTVVMGLRVQKERHAGSAGKGDGSSIGFSMAEYRERYRVGGDQLSHFRSDGILLHPGPVIKGIEFSAFVLNDPRCKVLDQVTNGVFVRAALMSIILGLEVQKA